MSPPEDVEPISVRLRLFSSFRLKYWPCVIFCSWSGGKDSCLSLYKAIQRGDRPKFLLTTCIETGGRSRSHGLSLEIFRAHALALNIPLFTIDTTWADYRNNFIRAIETLKTKEPSIMQGVFGDIDNEANGQWEKDVCQATDITAYLPLWKMERRVVLREFLDLGFKAMIVAVDSIRLHPEYLGRILDEALVKEFEANGIDPCGENGEYHTVVFDGPILAFPLVLERGIVVTRSGYHF